LAPVAEKMGIDLIWFGIILAMNMQTSFLTPPFGFALFYLRSVAARHDYVDVITKKTIPAVTTGQIYKGSIAFIILQLIMVAVIMINPEIVSGGITKVKRLSADQVENMLDIDTVDYGAAPALELPAGDGDLQLPNADAEDEPAPNLDMGQEKKAE